ncbi:MAG: sodium:solute symporter family protein [Armatimonadota bacterium]
MFGLSIIDIAVIIGYFAVTLGIGFWTMRRIKNQEDYFLGGRSFGKIIQTFAAFGQATSVDSAVGMTTTTFTNGAAAVWSSVCTVFTVPIYWMTCPWYRRLRLLSMGDFFRERYGSKYMAIVYALVASVGMMCIISIGFNAMGKTTVAMTPKTVSQMTSAERHEYHMAKELNKLEAADFDTLSDTQKSRLKELQILKPQDVHSHISESAIIYIVCFIVLVYSVVGGLHAAFLTDLMQGVFIIILSVILLPFGWTKLNATYGGAGVLNAFQLLHHRIPESFFEIFGSPSTMDFTWYYVLALTIMTTINVAAQPNQLVAIGSAKDEYTARLGFTSGIYLKRLLTIFWGLFGLFAVLLYTGTVRNPDMVWGYATLDLLGPMKMGLVGLMIACLMAALMSTASCLMITASGLLTHNVYRELLPNLPERHYVIVGRVIGGVVVIGGAIIATQFATIFAQMKFLMEFYSIFAASFWLGMLWRPATRAGAWASICIALVCFFVLPLAVPAVCPSLHTNHYLAKMTHARVVSRGYMAHPMDIEERNTLIAKWDTLNKIGKAKGERPKPIHVGEHFTKKYELPAKEIFWTQGLKPNAAGVLEGHGMLNLDLLLLQKLGFDLSKNPYAVNETLRVVFRTLIPIFAIFIVSMFTRHDNKEAINRFYAKMKTPALPDREADERELALSYAEPHRFDHTKLFPKSNWEFHKWDKVDAGGFLLALVVGAAIVGVFFLLMSIGVR